MHLEESRESEMMHALADDMIGSEQLSRGCVLPSHIARPDSQAQTLHRNPKPLNQKKTKPLNQKPLNP